MTAGGHTKPNSKTSSRATYEEDIKLEEATIVFYGLDPSKQILEGLERKLARGTRLITYYLCLFPDVMPVERDYPFFLSVKGDRFEPPKTALQ